MAIENKAINKETKKQKEDEATKRAQEIVDSFFSKNSSKKAGTSGKDPASIVAEAAGRTVGKLAVEINRVKRDASSISGELEEGALEEKLAQAYKDIPDKTVTFAAVQAEKSTNEEKSVDNPSESKANSEDKKESKEKKESADADKKKESSAKDSDEKSKEKKSDKDNKEKEKKSDKTVSGEKDATDSGKKKDEQSGSASKAKANKLSIHEQKTSILETRKSAFKSPKRASYKEHPASGNSMVFNAADVVSRLVQMPINKRNEKKEAEFIIKDARRAVLEEADYTSSYRAYSKMLSKGGARKSSVLSTLHKVPGCYVVATYPPKLKWDRDLASYTDIFVGSADQVGDGILECCSRHGCADVYADVKYRQNVQIFIFSCDSAELNPLREELIASLGANESYNKYL